MKTTAAKQNRVTLRLQVSKLFHVQKVRRGVSSWATGALMEYGNKQLACIDVGLTGQHASVRYLLPSDVQLTLELVMEHLEAFANQWAHGVKEQTRRRAISKGDHR